jgi:hypothetical protein
VLTFADANVIRLAQEQFVPVAADDWYQRRRQDAEGQFFRKVADQGPRKGEGGSTRQGIYVCTASGQLLAYRNHHDPAVMRGVLEKALEKWKTLPARERAPGALEVPDLGKTDAVYHRSPPKGGLIVDVFTRILDRTEKGDYCHGTCSFPGGDKAAHDHLWLAEEEWRGLLPKSPKKGDDLAVPDRLVQRIARFHLIDNTRGEPPLWERKQVRTARMKLLVEEVGEKVVRLRIEGQFLLATAADPARADRGFDARLLGFLEYGREDGKITRLNMVALGEHWGSGTFTRGARPGRTPLGVAFALARGDRPADQVPPQGSRYLRGYQEAEK